MQVQMPPKPMALRRLNTPTQGPTPPENPPPGGGHHQHGLSGALMHLGHDAAMLAMTSPSGGGHHGHHHHHAMQANQPTMVEICTSQGIKQVPLEDHSGHSGHSMAMDSGTHWLHLGSGVLSGLVAVGAAVHGVQMITSKDRFTQFEGANHLLMSASSGAMAAGMLAPQTGLGTYATPLMAAHGLAEVALGAVQIARGFRDDCSHDRLGGLVKLAHGGCLAAAQFLPGAAFPLYLGMAAATAAQISLQQSGLAH
jgi:hypothetical protein